ncbi:unnamed protein product [Schistocephalus solidus]|uniref:Uncharacterized protein n=1 Tax=Schistocephalus solidus TaxID=70667 RepID=A0A183T1I9_SCHSO|nr:unnamed protein product [Schistocephalus solidus]
MISRPITLSPPLPRSSFISAGRNNVGKTCVSWLRRQLLVTRLSAPTTTRNFAPNGCGWAGVVEPIWTPTSEQFGSARARYFFPPPPPHPPSLFRMRALGDTEGTATAGPALSATPTAGVIWLRPNRRRCCEGHQKPAEGASSPQCYA